MGQGDVLHCEGSAAVVHPAAAVLSLVAADGAVGDGHHTGRAQVVDAPGQRQATGRLDPVEADDAALDVHATVTVIKNGAAEAAAPGGPAGADRAVDEVNLAGGAGVKNAATVTDAAGSQIVLQTAAVDGDRPAAYVVNSAAHSAAGRRLGPAFAQGDAGQLHRATVVV